MPEPLNPVVVPREACPEGECHWNPARRCEDCLGDGTRAVLDQAQEVEQRREWDPCCGDGMFGPCNCTTGSRRTWAEVDRRPSTAHVQEAQA